MLTQINHSYLNLQRRSNMAFNLPTSLSHDDFMSDDKVTNDQPDIDQFGEHPKKQDKPSATNLDEHQHLMLKDSVVPQISHSSLSMQRSNTMASYLPNQPKTTSPSQHDNMPDVELTDDQLDQLDLTSSDQYNDDQLYGESSNIPIQQQEVSNTTLDHTKDLQQSTSPFDTHKHLSLIVDLTQDNQSTQSNIEDYVPMKSNVPHLLKITNQKQFNTTKDLQQSTSPLDTPMHHRLPVVPIQDNISIPSNTGDYIHMQSKPQLLKISYQNIQPTMCNIHDQIYEQIQDEIPSPRGILIPAPNDHDYLSCKASLYFSYHTGQLKGWLNEYNKDFELQPIVQWFEGCITAVRNTYNICPITTLDHSKGAHSSIENMKTLIKVLESVPESISALLPNKIKEKVEDLILEDGLTIQRYAFTKINILRQWLKDYELALKRLENRKKTRKIDKIIAGLEPIPLEFFEPPYSKQTPSPHLPPLMMQSPHINTSSHYVIVPDLTTREYETSIDNQNKSLECTPQLTQATSKQDGAQQLDIINQVDYLERNVQQSTTQSKQYDIVDDTIQRPITEERQRLETIPEEVQTIDEDKANAIISMIRNILSKDCEHPIEDPHHAVELLNEKLGLELSLHDSNIIEVLQTIHEQKVLLTMILSNRLPNPHGFQESPKFFTPGSASSLTPNDMYYTTPTTNNKGTNIANKAPKENLCTPKSTLMPSRKNLSISMEGLTMQNSLIGPELSNQTSQEDLIRHERALLHPPVRSKNVKTKTQPMPIYIDLAELKALPIDEQKQYLGEQLYALIKREVPLQATKITGMLLDLPIEELLHILEDKDILRGWIDEAISTLDNFEKQTNIADPIIEQETNDLCARVTNIDLQKSANKEQNVEDNDHHNAMFQEVVHDTITSKEQDRAPLDLSLRIRQHNTMPIINPHINIRQPEILETPFNIFDQPKPENINTIPYTSQQSYATIMKNLSSTQQQYNAKYIHQPLTKIYSSQGHPSHEAAPTFSYVGDHFRPFLPVPQFGHVTSVPKPTQPHTYIPSATHTSNTYQTPINSILRKDGQIPFDPTTTFSNQMHNIYKPLPYQHVPNNLDVPFSPIFPKLSLGSYGFPQYSSSKYPQVSHSMTHQASSTQQRAAEPQYTTQYQRHFMDFLKSPSIQPTTPAALGSHHQNTHPLPISSRNLRQDIPGQNTSAQQTYIPQPPFPQTIPQIDPQLYLARFPQSNLKQRSYNPYAKTDLKGPSLNKNPLNSTHIPGNATCPSDNRHLANDPIAIHLVLRERKELTSTVFLVQRQVTQLSEAGSMNSQELTDLLGNMKDFGRSLEKLENKASKFLKCLIENKQSIDLYNPELFGDMNKEINDAEDLSTYFQQKLNEADSIIRSEKITISQMNSADSKEVSYKEFNAGRSMTDPHIYEFISTLEMNFRICRTPTNVRPTILKRLLKGSAKLAIPDDLTDYQTMIEVLLQKFGNPIVILTNILDLHLKVGTIPSKSCQKPPWQKIEDTCKNHLFLIRKAEALRENPTARPQIFENSYRNFHLINLISHEMNEDLKVLQNSSEVSEMYRKIVKRFEEILASSSSNIDQNETKNKRDSADLNTDDRLDLDQCALAYGERKPSVVAVGRCHPQDCQFCVTMQNIGTGNNYFERHLLFGHQKKHYANNCPNYLKLSMEERISFINTNLFCPYCLKLLAHCRNKACGSDNLIPYFNGRKRNYVCQHKDCKTRIELCLQHRDDNKETLEYKKRNFKEKYQFDYQIALFQPINHNLKNGNGDKSNKILQKKKQIAEIKTTFDKVSTDTKTNIREKSPNFFLSVDFDQETIENLEGLQINLKTHFSLTDITMCKSKSLHITLLTGKLQPENIDNIYGGIDKAIKEVIKEKESLNITDFNELEQFKDNMENITDIVIKPYILLPWRINNIPGDEIFKNLNLSLKNNLNQFILEKDFKYVPHITLFKSKKGEILPSISTEQIDDFNRSCPFRNKIWCPRPTIELISCRVIGSGALIGTYNVQEGKFTSTSTPEQVRNLLADADKHINKLQSGVSKSDIMLDNIDQCLNDNEHNKHQNLKPKNNLSCTKHTTSLEEAASDVVDIMQPMNMNKFEHKNINHSNKQEKIQPHNHKVDKQLGISENDFKFQEKYIGNSKNIQTKKHSLEVTNDYINFKRNKRECQSNEIIEHKILLMPPCPTIDKECIMQESIVAQINTDYDKPLLVSSTNQLLENGAKLLADDCKSIFMYSKIQGLTRPLSCLFDSGGGSSLTLHNIPGRQLKAAKGHNKPVYLQGIGSGTTKGEQYTMNLPLLKGGDVAIEIFAVPQILQPMARMDLEPALSFFKTSITSAENVSSETKNEIDKASIFRFVEGQLDLLLGVKLLGIFPQLVHALPCGLSIFKMKLKPSNKNALYCLGGPFSAMSSLQGLFPDGAIMLQEIDRGLSLWRESTCSITDYSIPQSYIKNENQGPFIRDNDDHKHIQSNEGDTTTTNISNDEVVLGIQESETSLKRQHIKNAYPYGINLSRETVLQKAIRLHNEQRDSKIESQRLLDTNHAIIEFSNHMCFCKASGNTEDLIEDELEITQLRVKLGYLFRRYPTNLNSERTMTFLKDAICHLENCITKEKMTPNPSPAKPNCFIALECENDFIDELRTFQEFFLESFSELRHTMISPSKAHITLLAFVLPSEDDIPKASLAFKTGLGKWMDSSFGNNHMIKTEGAIEVSFVGVNDFDEKILYLRSDMGTISLTTMHSMLRNSLEAAGFQCDKQFTPHLTFAKLPFNSPIQFSRECIEKFSDIDLGSTKFKDIKMLSMKKDKVIDLHPCYESLTLSKKETEVCEAVKKAFKTGILKRAHKSENCYHPKILQSSYDINTKLECEKDSLAIRPKSEPAAQEGTIQPLLSTNINTSQQPVLMFSEQLNDKKCLTMEDKAPSASPQIPNCFITVECEENFMKVLNTSKSLFKASFPELKHATIKPNNEQITLLSFILPSEDDTPRAAFAFKSGLNQWLQSPFEMVNEEGAIEATFVGINKLDEGLLYLRSDVGTIALTTLHSVLRNSFEEAGFKCDKGCSPSLTFSEKCVEQFSDIDVGRTNFKRIMMSSIRKEKINGSTPRYEQTLTFSEQFSHETHKVLQGDQSTQTENSYLTAKFNKESKDHKELISHIQQTLDVNIPDPRCENCIGCILCKRLSQNNAISAADHREEYIIKSSIYFDEELGKFCSPLPFKEDPEISLAPNNNESKGRYFRVIKSLQDKPKDKEAILDSFNKLIELGYVQKLSEMDVKTQQMIKNMVLYVIPWNVVFKSTSISTPCRIVFNASAKTKTGKSLNSILCKGLPRLNLLPLILVLLQDSILMTMDLKKFYNSCLIPKSHYHLQCIWWSDDLKPEQKPELYVLKTHIYGMVSSSRVLELCLDKVAELNIHNKNFHKLISEHLYVDDGFANCKSSAEAEELRKDTETILSSYGFAVKGFAQSYIEPPTNISDTNNGHRTVGVIGMIWIPVLDVLKIRIPPLYFDGRKIRGKLETNEVFSGKSIESLDAFVPTLLTLRACASISASIWDPPGLLCAWFLGVKHILRLSVRSVSRVWDNPLPNHLRSQWLLKFWEMQLLKSTTFPRCTFPLGTNYSELNVVGLSDYGSIGKQQVFYSLKKIGEGDYHVQFIYAKSQLSDTKSVPCQELDSASTCATLLEKICLSLKNVSRKAILFDSTICAYWLLKDPLTLGQFHRDRVQNILNSCKTKDLFHIRSEWNSSDIGTKKPEPLDIILPGSNYSSGPQILQFGIDECMEKGFIKNINQVIIDPKNQHIALDGVKFRRMPAEYLTMAVLPLPIIDPYDNLLTDPSTDLSSTNTTETSNGSPDNTILSINQSFVGKLAERFQFQTYLVNPVKRPWSAAVRIMSIALHFISRLINKKLKNSCAKQSLIWERIKNNIFIRSTEPHLTESFTNLCFQEEISDGTMEETIPPTISNYNKMAPPIPKDIIKALVNQPTKARLLHSSPLPLSMIGKTIPINNSETDNLNINLQSLGNDISLDPNQSISTYILSVSNAKDIFQKHIKLIYSS